MTLLSTMHRTCSESGGTEGVDICTDDCGGYWNATFGDGYKYRYHIMGEYHTNTGVCAVPISPVPSEKYYPFSPVKAWARNELVSSRGNMMSPPPHQVCFKGCKPSGVSLSIGNDISLSSCSSKTTEEGYYSVKSAIAALPTNTASCAGYLRLSCTARHR